MVVIIFKHLLILVENGTRVLLWHSDCKVGIWLLLAKVAVIVETSVEVGRHSEVEVHLVSWQVRRVAESNLGLISEAKVFV